MGEGGYLSPFQCTPPSPSACFASMGPVGSPPLLWDDKPHGPGRPTPNPLSAGVVWGLAVHALRLQIDAGWTGNFMRFLNHSCEPNVIPRANQGRYRPRQCQCPPPPPGTARVPRGEGLRGGPRSGWRRLPKRLGALQMPSRLALAVRETVAGHRLGALEGGGGGVPPFPPFQCIPRGGSIFFDLFAKVACGS